MPFSCYWVDFCLERDGSDSVYRLVTAAHGPACSILKFVTAAAVPSPVSSASQMIFFFFCNQKFPLAILDVFV